MKRISLFHSIFLENFIAVHNASDRARQIFFSLQDARQDQDVKHSVTLARKCLQFGWDKLYVESID